MFKRFFYIIYFKDNNNYVKDYKISTNEGCYSVIQTKIDEICYSEKTKSAICFFDTLERKKKASINNISKINDSYERILMITKDLLFIAGNNKISLVNVNQHSLIRVIDIKDSGWIGDVCILNENTILTGDWKETIRQWKIEGDNLILNSKKEKTHDDDINGIYNLGNGYIITGSYDNSIKIW